MTRQRSYTICFNLKAVELADATSNRKESMKSLSVISFINDQYVVVFLNNQLICSN